MHTAESIPPWSSRFQSAAASWTRRNGGDDDRLRAEQGFNPPPRRGRGGILSRWCRSPPPACFNPPPRRGRGGIGADAFAHALHGLVSIRRRVVDAAEFVLLPLPIGVRGRFNPPPRRGRGGIQHRLQGQNRRQGFNPPPRRGRGGILAGLGFDHLAHRFQSAAASWTRRNTIATISLKLKKVFQSAAASWTRRNNMSGNSSCPARTVSIRRRVVDAAEFLSADERLLYLLCFNPPPRRGRGGI